MLEREVKRRKRVTQVCSNCKRRKIKCDKKIPCTQCSKLNTADSCAYQSEADVNKAKALPYLFSAKRPLDFKESVQQSDPALSELSILRSRLESLENSLRKDKEPKAQEPKPEFKLDPKFELNFDAKSDPKSDFKSGTDNRWRSSSNDSQFHFTPTSEFSDSTGKSDTTNSPSLSKGDITSLNGFNVYDDANETINFYENYSSLMVTERRVLNFGPLSWASAMKKDPALLLVLDACVDKNRMSMAAFESKLKVKSDNDTENTFCRRLYEDEGYQDTAPISDEKEPCKAHYLNKTTLSLGLTYFEGEVEKEILFIDKVTLMLPSKKTVWMLLDRYFNHMYPYVPYVDEESFIFEITRIIGPKSYEEEKIKVLNITQKLDFAHIGILMVVLRLSYLSLFSNAKPVDMTQLKLCQSNQEIVYLLLNPINIDSIDVAEECLQHFNLFIRLNFPIFQLAFLISIYRHLSPEGGEGPLGDGNIFHGLLVKMAYSMGLHRDPSNFPNELQNPKMNNLRRKIWMHLQFKDLYLCLKNGDPPTIDSNFCDTKPPSCLKEECNVKNAELDYFVPTMCKNLMPCTLLAESIIKDILRIDAKIPISNLVTTLSHLERQIVTTHGDLGTVLRREEKGILSTKSFYVKTFIALKGFLILIYFHLFLHFERNKSQLSFFYLKKIIMFNVNEVMPYYFDILDNGDSFFDLLVNPALLEFNHMSNEVCLALILRINFSIHRMKIAPDHYRKMASDSAYSKYFKGLCKMSSSFTRCAEVSVSAIFKISNRYFYAWKITKFYDCCLRIVTSTEFYYEHHARAKDIAPTFYTLPQVEELTELCEATLSKFGKNKSNTVSKSGSPFNNETVPTNNTANQWGTTDDQISQVVLDPLNTEEIDKVWHDIISFKSDKLDKLNEGLQGTPNIPYSYDFQTQTQSQNQNQNQNPSQGPPPGVDAMDYLNEILDGGLFS